MAKSYLLIITHSTDDPDRANSAIALAVSLLSEGAEVTIFFTFHGALLAKRGWPRPWRDGTSPRSASFSR